MAETKKNNNVQNVKKNSVGKNKVKKSTKPVNQGVTKNKSNKSNKVVKNNTANKINTAKKVVKKNNNKTPKKNTKSESRKVNTKVSKKVEKKSVVTKKSESQNIVKEVKNNVKVDAEIEKIVIDNIVSTEVIQEEKIIPVIVEENIPVVIADSLEVFDNISEEVDEVKELDISLKEHNDESDIKDENSKIDNSDLIITREINFSDDVNFKDKKTLDELREAIEEFDRASNKEEMLELEDSADDPEAYLRVTTPFIFTNNARTERKYNEFDFTPYLVGAIVILLILFFVMMYLSFSTKMDDSGVILNNSDEISVVDETFKKCIRDSNYDVDDDKEIELYMEELADYLKSEYKVSVIYEDLNTGFKFSYNDDVEYSASDVMKVLTALYIYSKAENDDLDLDYTIAYMPTFEWGNSSYLGRLDFGTEISLRDLVKYSVTLGDNSAYLMLLSYIGEDELKKFAEDLGATNVFTSNDKYGFINSKSALIYMKELYKFFTTNKGLGKELESYFLESSDNGLSLLDLEIKSAHKNSSNDSYYHDIGIVYDKNPYVITILSREGGATSLEVMRDINRRIYELHTLYHNVIEESCRLQVYGE